MKWPPGTWSSLHSNPGFLEAQDKALSSFWFGGQRPPNLSLTCMYGLPVWQIKKQQLHSCVWLNGAEEMTTQTEVPWLDSPRPPHSETTGVKWQNKPCFNRACPFPSIFTTDKSSNAESTIRPTHGVLSGLHLRKWQPPLWVNKDLPMGLCMKPLGLAVLICLCLFTVSTLFKKDYTQEFHLHKHSK